MKILTKLAAATILFCGCAPASTGLTLGHTSAAYMGTISADPNPLSFWWYAGDPKILRPALECALTRIRQASCLPVNISFDAAHWIRQDTAAAMGGRSGWTTGTWASTRIRVLDTYDAAWSCRILVHEIGEHLLRKDNGHTGNPGNTRLVEPLLTAICAENDCGCYIPEPATGTIPALEGL